MSAEITAELPNPFPDPEPEPARGRRLGWSRRRTVVAAGVAVCAVAGALVGATDAFGGSGSSHASADPAATGATRTVTEGPLSSQTQVAATLGYAGSYDVTNQLGAGSGSSGGSSPAGLTAADDPMTAPAAVLTAFVASSGGATTTTPPTSSTSSSTTTSTTPSSTTTVPPPTTAPGSSTTAPGSSTTTTTAPPRRGQPSPPATSPPQSGGVPQQGTGPGGGGGSSGASGSPSAGGSSQGSFHSGGSGSSGSGSSSSGGSGSSRSGSSGSGGGSSGSSGSGGSASSQPPNVVTALPAAGQVVSEGQGLYSVNGLPVVLLYGSTPSYRALSEGDTGADVAELNADLVALGYATSSELAPTSTTFSSATVTALEKLQAHLGLPQTGSLALGQAVFLPTSARVTAVSATLGAPLSYGAQVLQATSTTRQVQVALDATQQTDVAVGDKVSITLPNNKTTPGTVSSVGTVATCPSGSGSGGSGSGSGSGSSSGDTCSSGSGSSGSSTPPTVTVDIAPTDPRATGTWDQAPVEVTITTGSVANALVVPVAALLAQSGGAYAVEVVGAGGVGHLVPVTLGLFDDADGLVQVTGAGLAAGQKVVVPST